MRLRWAGLLLALWTLVAVAVPWLPLQPDHIALEAILAAISLYKDVDGFHPVNIGRLAMKGRDPLFIPATPYGCMYMLEEAERLIDGFSISGSNAVVLGRSNIVGMPAAMLLVHRNATVTICHSRTKDLPAVCRQADILVADLADPAGVDLVVDRLRNERLKFPL